jgi:hypothetical protein
VRRLVFCLVLFAALLPVPTRAATRHPLIRIYPGAGFHHAMRSPRTPIRVEYHPELNLIQGMSYWNEVAGWHMFQFADDTHPAEIFVKYDTGPSALWSSNPPYTSCTIQERYHQNGPSDWILYSHELGHCLGWTDRLDTHGWGVNAGYYNHSGWDMRLMRSVGYGIEYDSEI